MKQNTQKLAYTSICTALICVLTLFTHIPLPLANGRYVHLGDAAIFLTGILFGPLPAAFAAGVGSALADALSGATLWVIPTLIVKSVMGLFIGWFANHYKYLCVRNFIGMFLAGVIMSIGYTLTEIFAFGIAPLAELVTVHFYFIQFISGIVVATIVLATLRKVKHSNPWY